MPLLLPVLRMPIRRHTHAHHYGDAVAAVSAEMNAHANDHSNAPSSSSSSPVAHSSPSTGDLPSIAVAPPGTPSLSKRLPFRRHSQVAVSMITTVDIYYGSMTGTAERFAHILAGDIVARGVDVRVHDIANIDESFFASPSNMVQSRVSIFVCATHFAGAPSPSAERFHTWLRNLCEFGPASVMSLAHGGATGEESTTPAPASSTSTWSAFFSRIKAGIVGDTRHHSYWRHSLFVGLQYAVFGVGDSAYLTYNAMGKFVDAKLSELGATRFCPTGLGDVSQDIGAAFTAWKTSFLCRLPFTPSATRGKKPVICASDEGELEDEVGELLSIPSRPRSPTSPLRQAAKAKLKMKPKPDVLDILGRPVHMKYRCRILEKTKSKDLVNKSDSSILPPSETGMIQLPRPISVNEQGIAEVVTIHRVPAAQNDSEGAIGHDNFSKSLIMRLRLQDPTVTFEPADRLHMFPQNPKEVVKSLADAFNFDLDAQLEFYMDNGRAAYVKHQHLPFPNPSTVRDILTSYLEICTVSREFLRIASGFASVASERELLEHMASTDGSETFKTKMLDHYKGVFDVTLLAPSLKIPFEVFMNITPLIKPRVYAITSSPLISGKEFDVAISLGRSQETSGLAVTYAERLYLESSACPAVIRGYISSSDVRVSDDPASPLILIANGVGVGSMRGLLQNRIARCNNGNDPDMIRQGTQRGRTHSNCFVACTNNILFLGATHKESVVFSHDLDQWESAGMVQIFRAFSRESDTPSQHVQDVVACQVEHIVSIMQATPTGSILVCGKTSMVRQIRELFSKDQDSRCSKGDSSSNWFNILVQSGRYIEEGFG